jgi:hypothetical protein
MLLEPRCSERRCKHLIGIVQPDGDEMKEVVICNAFPDGKHPIPNDIAYGIDLHLQPHEGQKNDIVFEPSDQPYHRSMEGKEKDNTPLHQAADKQVESVSVAFRYAFALGRKALGKDIKVDAAVEAVRKALKDVLPKTLLAVLKVGGEVGIASLEKQLRVSELRLAAEVLTMKFDSRDPRAVAWAEEHAAELIDGVTETTRERIKAAIATALESGTLDDARDDIANAVGDDARADLIARTEVMTATNEGNREAWDQAVEEGLLTGNERREWIATSDACPLCDELDGETAPLDGEYPGDGGDGPPLHPACRCTEGLTLSD